MNISNCSRFLMRFYYTIPIPIFMFDCFQTFVKRWCICFIFSRTWQLLLNHNCEQYVCIAESYTPREQKHNYRKVATPFNLNTLFLLYTLAHQFVRIIYQHKLDISTSNHHRTSSKQN